MPKIRQEDHDLLQPGMRVRIAQKLMGEELYGADDPEDYEKWLGQEVTVRYVKQYTEWIIGIEEDKDVEFYLEEIECIVDEAELSESDESLDTLLGGIA